jgi:hypothetical protein
MWWLATCLRAIQPADVLCRHCIFGEIEIKPGLKLFLFYGLGGFVGMLLPGQNSP